MILGLNPHSFVNLPAEEQDVYKRQVSSHPATSSGSSWLRSAVRVLSMSSTSARMPFCASHSGVMWVKMCIRDSAWPCR